MAGDNQWETVRKSSKRPVSTDSMRRAWKDPSISVGLLSQKSVWEDWSGSGRGRHIRYNQGEVVPVKLGRQLGSGAHSIVQVVTCREIKLARKQIRNKKLIGQNEIGILEKLNHRHIIKLVGTYTHEDHQNLLLWPIAAFNLSDFFKSLDILYKHIREGKPNGFPIASLPEDAQELKIFVSNDNESPQVSIGEVIDASAQRLWASFGCLSGAIAYLHGKSIRHKDLKPANILIYPDGIRLTDFGISRDFSELDFSETSSGGGTLKYYAPEVAGRSGSGRAADIFSLGCIFLEVVALTTVKGSLKQLGDLCPKWPNCYQANLENRRQWFDVVETQSPVNRHLLCEIEQMLDETPGLRPTAQQLVTRLAIIEHLGKDPENPEKPLHGNCCKVSALAQEEIQAIAEVYQEGSSSQPAISQPHPNPKQGEHVSVASFFKSSSVIPLNTIVLRNRKGQRIDPTPRPFDRDEVNYIRSLHLCNFHYLVDECTQSECQHSHKYEPTSDELGTLLLINRLIPCSRGVTCDIPKCIYGHQCHNTKPSGAPGKGKNCFFKNCNFLEEMHNMDLEPVDRRG